MYRLLIIVITLICGFTTLNSWAKEIIHDGEFNYLKAQHGEQWAAEDKDIESKLAAIRAKNGGKRPNILYILVDDVGFGDFGMPGLNYVRGTQTPHINTLATEGVSLMRMYTEPSCTPTRVAFMTGRHPIRSGMGEVKVALVGEGLSENEVTIAEILSKAGYNTAHIGKWHMGDIEQAFPHNQGFDFAAFPVHQQVQLSLMTAEGDHATQLSGWYEGGNTDRFAIDERFKPYGLVTALEGKKGGKAREVDMQAGEEWTQKKYNDMHERYQRQTLEQLRVLSAKDDPFFIQYWPLIPLNFVRSDREQFNTANGGTAVESMQQLDGYVGEILAEVDKLGIADNTLVVLMADNGPFLFGYQSVLGMSDMVYRGGKTDTTEGGIRVNAFMRWPGVIEQGSFAGDMFHVSDLFSTFAHLGDATKYIPTDRIIDGIDQTALLLNGETHGRRDYVYVYGGFNLAAVVKQKFKMHLPPPGVPGAAAPVYDLMRDPREEKSLITAALWSGASFQDMVKRHKISMKKYPNLPIGTDKPYGGIENLRPETKATVENFMSWH
jgi:arylsulfatase A-like enzyme